MAINHLKQMIAIQTSVGTVDYDEYQFGMANGMLYALSLMTGEEPKYVEAPAVWIKDLKRLDEFNESGAVIKNEQ
jgi:hypothetical protein